MWGGSQQLDFNLRFCQYRKFKALVKIGGMFTHHDVRLKLLNRRIKRINT